eukprot:SAG31_NODE_40455_length_280_cov_1.447514_1_plen_24_part_10
MMATTMCDNSNDDRQIRAAVSYAG